MSQSENIRIIKMSNEYYKMIEENEKYKEDLKNEFQVYINIAINNISKVTTIIDNIEDERTNINENEKEDIDNLYKIQGDYKFIANIKGFENLNNSLTNLVKENKKLNVDNNLLKMKIVDVQKELTKIKKNFSAQDEKIKNSTIKIKKIMTENHSEIVNLCQYIFFKKRKNRSRRELIETHRHCTKCEKNDKKIFFSFPIKPSLIELLKSRGLEDLVYFNEKSCCNEIEKMFLKALKYVSMIYPTKCELWYRNFLCKKYYVNQPSNMSYTKTHSKHIDERFYKTYLSEKKFQIRVFLLKCLCRTKINI